MILGDNSARCGVIIRCVYISIRRENPATHERISASSGLILDGWPRTVLLYTELVEQGLRVFQVGGVEAFGEPVVDVGEHGAGLVAMALRRE